MRIENDSNRRPFKTLASGQCFEFQNDLYLKTSAINAYAKNSDNSFNAVDLLGGIFVIINPDEEVMLKPNAKIVFE